MPTPAHDFYARLTGELAALLDGERDLVANAANTAALLGQRLDQVNWVGFYFLRGGELVVGPFQGRPACVRIPLGAGVCGTAAARGESLVVADVDQFPGHISCDARSRSEMVVPLIAHGQVVGVLDLDSPVRDRFDEVDRLGLEQLVESFLQATDLVLAPIGVGALETG